MNRIVHALSFDRRALEVDDQNCAPQLAQNAAPESLAVPQFPQKAV